LKSGTCFGKNRLRRPQPDNPCSYHNPSQPTARPKKWRQSGDRFGFVSTNIRCGCDRSSTEGIRDLAARVLVAVQSALGRGSSQIVQSLGKDRRDGVPLVAKVIRHPVPARHSPTSAQPSNPLPEESFCISKSAFVFLLICSALNRAASPRSHLALAAPIERLLRRFRAWRMSPGLNDDRIVCKPTGMRGQPDFARFPSRLDNHLGQPIKHAALPVRGDGLALEA